MSIRNVGFQSGEISVLRGTKKRQGGEKNFLYSGKGDFEYGSRGTRGPNPMKGLNCRAKVEKKRIGEEKSQYKGDTASQD